MPPPTQPTRAAPGVRTVAPSGRTSLLRAPRGSSRHVAGSSGSASSLAAARRAASPAGSVASVATTAASAGAKRKEREFDAPEPGHANIEETNINVVVRCRGRNEREVRENSAVVVKTDGVKGSLVELSMGPNALSNKSYSFDRAFSPAADQSMIFDDVVKPILDEMLAGFNCTIFAYGQTGTGKTYTMSGDMTETMGLLSEEAGIIPRVLHALFNRLQIDDKENCVKCSFIELYNEELRDLISVEETAKLKIYDDTSRRGHAATVVQGMEEKHIKNAAEGIKVLQDGSLKRRVAATKCNDLSSRSHTVFTVTTACVKRTADGQEDFVTTGKLNLVDLAGSENIQRSGAENKRAAEAGLINKSLLTLGRVINALVDRSAHIPYRESKLTRLLQDSLGGRTKTCIIATVSPAKVNLEETISTLDYAFRAKNIRNKPQVNLLLNKSILLQDFAAEIERLKSELIQTRLRNGVYLSNEAYEEMSADRESRRIVMEEQSAKIETLETNLRSKVHELFELTSAFMGVKKDHEGTKARLDDARGVLEQTEIVLAAARRSLAEETHLRRAHQDTEERLAEIGGQLIRGLRRTVHDVGGLHAKNKRRSDLHLLNRDAWATSQDSVAEITSLVEERVRLLRRDQEDGLAAASRRARDFVAAELAELASAKTLLDDRLDRFAESRRRLLEHRDCSRDEMDAVLDEIKDVRDAVKERVGESLQAIAAAAERIAAGVAADMAAFHNQLHASYSSLGKDFKAIFEDLMKHVAAQRAESETLRQQLEATTGAVVEQNTLVAHRVQSALADERRQAADDRTRLLAQVAELVGGHADRQQARMVATAAELRRGVHDASSSLEAAVGAYGQGMDSWNAKEDELLEDVRQSRDRLKGKLKDDWTTANTYSTSIQEVAKSVHSETVRIVDEQVRDLDVQMEELDDFVTRARYANSHHHATQADDVASLSGAVDQSLAAVAAHLAAASDRVRLLGDGVATDTDAVAGALHPLDEDVCGPLAALRETITGTALREYVPTGETPRKNEQYHFPTTLPRTQPHAALLASLRDPPSPGKATAPSGPPTPTVFPDVDAEASTLSLAPPPDRTSLLAGGLREVNPNISAGPTIPPQLSASTGAFFDPAASTASMAPPESTVPLLKRSLRASRGTTTAVVAGRENVPPAIADVGGSRRKSPRLN